MVKHFQPVQNKRDLLRGICLLLLVILSNILLTVGQSLITSMYFIYVPHHERLFTKMVNHFGQKTIQCFLMAVIVPFTALNLIVNGMIYLWKDLDDWFNNSTGSDSLSKSYSNNISNYQDYYESESSLHRSRPGSIGIPDLNSPQEPSSLMLISSPIDYPHHYGPNIEDYDTSSPRILIFAKNLITSWKRIAVRDSFVLTTMFMWGLAVFIAGIISTITF